MYSSPTTDSSVRVQYRDEHRKFVRIRVKPDEAQFLHDNKIATYKDSRQREMTLRHGLSLSRTERGALEFGEVCFLSSEPRQFLLHCIEKWHRLRLNCFTWKNRGYCEEPYKPLKLILSI